MGKGSHQRPTNKSKYDFEYEKIFGGQSSEEKTPQAIPKDYTQDGTEGAPKRKGES